MKAKQVDNQLDSSGAQVRVSTQFSERWSGAFSIGGRHSEGSGLSTDGGNGWLAEARVNRKDELGSWEAAVSRTVETNNNNTLVRRGRGGGARGRGGGPRGRGGGRAGGGGRGDGQT